MCDVAEVGNAREIPFSGVSAPGLEHLGISQPENTFHPKLSFSLNCIIF